METKTIRFEKGELYYPHVIPDINTTGFLEEDEKEWPLMRCLKSFTVQINIIEDEED